MTKQQALQLLSKPLSEMSQLEKNQLKEAMKIASQLTRPF